jgi:hypothetical protein
MPVTNEDLDAAISEIQMIISADGARLDVISADVTGVRLAVDLSGATCADCVLPPERLREIVELSIRRRAGDDSLSVAIDDPRAGAGG